MRDARCRVDERRIHIQVNNRSVASEPKSCRDTKVLHGALSTSGASLPASVEVAIVTKTGVGGHH
jgi:hypothetical protein